MICQIMHSFVRIRSLHSLVVVGQQTPGATAVIQLSNQITIKIIKVFQRNFKTFFKKGVGGVILQKLFDFLQPSQLI